MSKATRLVERTQSIELAEAGLTDRQIAKQVNRSIEVVRKWRRRGRDKLKSEMGRPQKVALSSYPAEIKETIDRWRESHPGWGEKTLQAELKNQVTFKDIAIPSAATIGRYLKEQSKTRPYQRHSQLLQPIWQLTRTPHQGWQMDAQGYQPIADVGQISLINLNDVHSHLRLLS